MLLRGLSEGQDSLGGWEDRLPRSRMGTGGKAKTHFFRGELFFSEAAERKRPPCRAAWTLNVRLKELPDSPRHGQLPGSLVAAAVLCFYRRDAICAVLDKGFMARRTKRTTAAAVPTVGAFEQPKSVRVSFHALLLIRP